MSVKSTSNRREPQPRRDQAATVKTGTNKNYFIAAQTAAVSTPTLTPDTDIIAGLHAVRTVLTHGGDQVKALWYDPGRHDQKLLAILEQAANLQLQVQKVDRDTLDQLTQGINHQGVAARITAPPVWSEANLTALLDKLTVPPFLLILDGVQDPHNLGACLRTAEAAGVHAVIAPKNNSVGLTTTVCKVASGAASLVPYVQVTNLARMLVILKERGLWLTGTAENAPTSLYKADLRGPLALVLGGEGNGLRRLTREHCDFLVSLPMQGAIESLNVSVATGIILYEALRQRNVM